MLLYTVYHPVSVNLIAYNIYHPQLFATSTVDTRIVLWGTDNSTSRTTSSTTASLIEVYDAHDDIPCCMQWSYSDYWVLFCLSCDGRLIIHPVNEQVKYNILL